MGVCIAWREGDRAVGVVVCAEVAPCRTGDSSGVVPIPPQLFRLGLLLLCGDRIDALHGSWIQWCPPSAAQRWREWDVVLLAIDGRAGGEEGQARSAFPAQ
jgi:hypothetical protein